MKTLVIVATIGTALAAGASSWAMSAGSGTRAHPYPTHRFVKLPESNGWYLRVNGVVRNANSIVHAANGLNKPPARGRQFFLIGLTYLNRSKKSGDILSLGELSAIGRSNVAYHHTNRCGVVPHGLKGRTTVPPRGRLTGNVCFSVRRKDVTSLKLYFTSLFSGATVFFALR